MIMSVFVRRLREGATYEDFRAAWYPDKGFGVRARVLNGVGLADPRDILSIGFVDVAKESMGTALADVAAQERTRHDRIEALLDGTAVRAMFELVDDQDFSAAPRPFAPTLGSGLLH